MFCESFPREKEAKEQKADSLLGPLLFFFYPSGQLSPDQQKCDLHRCGWIKGAGQSDTSCQDSLSTVASVLFMRPAAFSSMADHFSMQDEPKSVDVGIRPTRGEIGGVQFLGLLPKEGAGCIHSAISTAVTI